MKLYRVLAGLTATVAIACRGAAEPPEPPVAPPTVPAPPAASAQIAPQVIPDAPKSAAAPVTSPPSAKPQTSADVGTPALAQLGERCGGYSPNPKRCAAGLTCAVRKDGAVDAPSVCVSVKP